MLLVVELVKDEERFRRQARHLTEKCPRRTRAVKKLEQKGRAPVCPPRSGRTGESALEKAEVQGRPSYRS